MREIRTSEIDKFYSLLEDDESRAWFDARINYLVYRNAPDFIKSVRQINHKRDWHIIGYDDFTDQYQGQKIVIFGAGEEGLLTEKILEDNGFTVYAYCDNDPEKQGGVRLQTSKYINLQN